MSGGAWDVPFMFYWLAGVRSGRKGGVWEANGRLKRGRSNRNTVKSLLTAPDAGGEMGPVVNGGG